MLCLVQVAQTVEEVTVEDNDDPKGSDTGEFTMKVSALLLCWTN